MFDSSPKIEKLRLSVSRDQINSPYDLVFCVITAGGAMIIWQLLWTWIRAVNGKKVRSLVFISRKWLSATRTVDQCARVSAAAVIFCTRQRKWYGFDYNLIFFVNKMHLLCWGPNMNTFIILARQRVGHTIHRNKNMVCSNFSLGCSRRPISCSTRTNL